MREHKLVHKYSTAYLHLLTALVLQLATAVSSSSVVWQENTAPRIYLQPREWRDYSVFHGNTTHSDHFTTLLKDGNSILVGGRNILYKLSVKDLRLEQSLVWRAKESDAQVCVLKGKSESACQNYIKVLARYKHDSGRYLVCGTNAYKPICREYVDDAGSYLMTSNEESSGNMGVGYCPYSPYDNSTAVLVGDRLFSGTTADAQGVDALIYSSPLRTPQFDSMFLNKPSFVGSFATFTKQLSGEEITDSKELRVSDGEFVYFFFREDSMEYMNCGKKVYSRVARVCQKDTGGTRSLNNKWTSFIKARLNCSMPGEFPFYFDEIQDISEVVQGIYDGDIKTRTKLLYAVFTTPDNSIGGSALCAFSLAGLEAAFDGRFKEQGSSNQNWLAVEPHKVPSPRPGTCTNDSKSDLNDKNMNFIKSHPLMNDAVQPHFPSPLLIQTGLSHSTGFSSVAVHPQVQTSSGEFFDVIFVGTRSGHLLKTVNTMPTQSSGYKPVLIEDIDAVQRAIIQLEVVNVKKDRGYVIVASAGEVRSYPLHRCDKATTCHDCVALQDPYCAWNTRVEECSGSAAGWTKGSHGTYLQAIMTGIHKGCPHISTAKHKKSGKMSGKNLGTVINSIEDRREEEKLLGINNDVIVTEDYPFRKVAPELYTLDTLAISVSAGAVAALLVGFISGYCCGRNCGKDPNNLGYRDTEYEYLEQRHLPSRPLPANPPTLQPLLANSGGMMTMGGDQMKGGGMQVHEEQVYAEPILVNHQYHTNTTLSSSSAGNGNGVLPQLPVVVSSLPINNPLGTTLGPPPPKPFPPSSGMGGLYSSAHNNKFNTISNVNKRHGLNNRGSQRGGGGMMYMPPQSLTDDILPNHYEKARMVGGGYGVSSGVASVTGGGGLHYGVAGRIPTTSTIYHMGTLSKGVKAGLAQQQAEQNQVVDSAYGTTRSMKKVYL